MTVRYPRAFEQSAAAGFDGLFDWDFLLPAFEGTKIEPMDLDAIVERNGMFLVFETKQDDAPISLGQQITLERLVETGLFTVITLRAKVASKITRWDVWFKGGRTGRVIKEYYEGDAGALTAFVKRWFIWASCRGVR